MAPFNRRVVTALGFALLTASRGAHAYTIETAVTRGCHEQITADILRATRRALPGMTPPLPSTGDDKALIDDTPFTVPHDLGDIGAVTLLFGVRDNDVKVFAAMALDQLAALNADPTHQREHCLRLANQDEPSGSAEAVADCRAYIKETLLSALEGLDENGLPDPKRRDDLEVTLAIRGQVHVSVPRFYLRAGRALHAIEDSFTHSFRNRDDQNKITVVLNWVEYANKDLVESRDGPAHMTELDRCDDPDDLRKQKRLLAIDAGTQALSLLLSPGMDLDEKSAAIDTLLDEHVVFDSTSQCSEQNHWCDAPENAYRDSGCGCKTAVGTGSGKPWTVATWLALSIALYRFRRRRSARPRRHQAFGAIAAALFFLAQPRLAHAEGDAPPANFSPDSKGPLNALEGNSNSGALGTRDPSGAFFGRIGFGASYDKPGFAGGLGIRYQISKPFMIGLDSEINPWISLTPSRVRTGAWNSYVSIIRRFQLENAALNVRSQLGVGVSVLLIDLVGAPAGSFGPFFGLSLLGAEWKIHRGYYLTIDPTYIAFPVPHLTAAPFGYMQYRFQLGLEFGG